MPKGIYKRTKPIWNKGKKMSQQMREKMRLYSKKIGRVPPSQLGVNQSEETKLKRLNSRRNNGKPWYREGFRKKISGSNHWAWKGGFSPQYKVKTAPREKSNQCEICSSKNRICFDHDHKTGKFRGWICTKCNTVIGMANDNIEILYKVIEYLKNSK